MKTSRERKVEVKDEEIKSLCIKDFASRNKQMKNQILNINQFGSLLQDVPFKES